MGSETRAPAGRLACGGILLLEPPSQTPAMKSARFTAICAVLLAGAARSPAVLGTITASASPAGPVTLGSTFTISLSISGYTEATQIDAYQFNVAYPSALFTFLGPFDSGSSAVGPNQQWLSMAGQESAGDGYAPFAAHLASPPGTILIDYSDLGFSVVEGGTNAASGFLVSFLMRADGLGTGSFTPSAPAGGVTFLDVDLLSAGSPAFAGSSVTVVPEPSGFLLAGAGLLAAARRRRK